MKTLKNLKKFYVIALTVLVAYSCGKDDPPAGPNLYDLIVSSGTQTTNFEIFIQAIDRAELADELKGNGTNYTVFAPDDAAFSGFFADNGYANINAVPLADLKKLMRYHIVEGKSTHSALIGQGSGYLTSLAPGPEDNNGISMFFYDNGGDLEVNAITVISIEGTQASNGIYHVVEAVIDIPTVLTFIDADPAFGSLREAIGLVDAGNGNNDYSDGFSATVGGGIAPLTVLAPDNTAFNAALADLGVGTLGDVPVGTLENIVDGHIIINTNSLSTDLMAMNGQQITTVNGQITVNVAGEDISFTDVNGRAAVVTRADIQAGNGVIHVLALVLLPPL